MRCSPDCRPRSGCTRRPIPVIDLRPVRHVAPAGRRPGGDRVAADRLGARPAGRGGDRRLPRRRRAARADGRCRAHRARRRTPRLPGQLPVALGARRVHGGGGDHHRLLAGQAHLRHLDRAQGPLLRDGRSRSSTTSSDTNATTLVLGVGRPRRAVRAEAVRTPGPRRARGRRRLDPRRRALRPRGSGRQGRRRHPRLAAGIRPPRLRRLADRRTWPTTAFVITLVGFMESIAVAKVYARRHRYEVDANQRADRARRGQRRLRPVRRLPGHRWLLPHGGQRHRRRPDPARLAHHRRRSCWPRSRSSRRCSRRCPTPRSARSSSWRSSASSTSPRCATSPRSSGPI